MGKQGYYRQMELAQPQAYALAGEIMAAGALTPDGQEGIAAFLEKRPAHYR
jgi:enoyl-CoA hydratase/carnithine racemase